MKTTLLISLIVCICDLAVYSQTIYVDSNTGDDKNPGTKEAPVSSIKKAAEIIRSGDNDIYNMKINPGIYVLGSYVSVSTEKEKTDKRIIIEASILPDDPSWTPEKMPIIISTSKKGEVPGENYHFVVSFLINESHVTIRGIKFPGYYYPNTRYFPIARFNKTKTDLLVEQCLFVGDEDASHLQVGIIAHGNKIRADHCIFYNARNSVVFWQNAGGGVKTGNGITNSIIYGTTQSAVWTAWPDKDFIFENNIIANCNYVWMKNSFNSTRYTMNNCIVVNNNNYQGDESRQPTQFALDENNVIKNGKVLLRKKESNVHLPLPKDYLHIIPGALGYDIGAGIFKSVKNRK